MVIVLKIIILRVVGLLLIYGKSRGVGWEWICVIKDNGIRKGYGGSPCGKVREWLESRCTRAVSALG